MPKISAASVLGVSWEFAQEEYPLKTKSIILISRFIISEG
jgi:hypothetical protein